jgi:mRNA-degrading endonuclease RelE of RelBE toxin-antitoxin system
LPGSWKADPMREFNVTLSPAIQKDLRKLDKGTAHQILGEMQVLKENPFPRGSKIKKLATGESEYRMRAGNYRVV